MYPTRSESRKESSKMVRPDTLCVAKSFGLLHLCETIASGTLAGWPRVGLRTPAQIGCPCLGKSGIFHGVLGVRFAWLRARSGPPDEEVLLQR